ncbi:MAG: hypothetical protein ABI333_04230 [bacterium]
MNDPVDDSASAPDDLYIVSDLHLSMGRSPGEWTYKRLESFFYDAQFSRFVDHILRERRRRDRRVTLILGGDTLDFLTVTEVPSRQEALEEGIVVSGVMKRVGLSSSSRHANWKLQRIVEGHPRFFEALGRLLANGNRIVVIAGNHDAELYWGRVRSTLSDVLLAAVEHVDPDADLEAVAQRIEYRQWFYYEKGRIFFEHGNQYEASNSFRYNLCPEYLGRSRSPAGQLDLPVGSMFVQHIYNAVRRRSPYLSNMVSMEQYMSGVARLNLVEMLGVLFRRVPFFFQALRATRLFATKAQHRCRRIHEYRLAELAEHEALPAETLKRIQDRRAMPDGMTKYHLAESILRPVISKVIKYALFALLGVFVWFLIFSLIQSTPWVAAGVFTKASFTALLAMATLVSFFVLFNRFFSRIREAPSGVPPEVYTAARTIAQETQVPFVVMGHTHLAEVRPLDDRGTLFVDTGTWTSISGAGDALWPSNRRFTFARLRDHQIDLLRWNDVAGRVDEVFMFEDYQRKPGDVLFPEDPTQAVHLPRRTRVTVSGSDDVE